jgi:hypothetical protein
MFFVQIEIAIGIEIVLAVEVSFLFDFDFDFDFDCPASSLQPPASEPAARLQQPEQADQQESAGDQITHV